MTLDDLATHLATRGHRVRRGCYFSENGITVSESPLPPVEEPPPPTSDRVVVGMNLVFIYWRAGAWEVRITWHGGPHWIRRCADLRDAEEALMALSRDGRGTRARPPSEDWRLADE